MEENEDIHTIEISKSHRRPKEASLSNQVSALKLHRVEEDSED